MKPVFIDVHCHLDMCEGRIEDIIERAKVAGVGVMVTQGVKPESNRKSLEFSSRFDIVKSALGMYPIDALKMSDSEVDSEIKFIRENKDKIVAIGEVGMDFKEDEKEHSRQVEIFKKVIKLALELDKPLIVHSRKAERECIEVLEEMKAKKVVMHCFNGKFSLVKRIIDNGWFLTIPTNVKSSEHFQKVALNAPISQLLCETDSPYLHPDKKWPNEPANVVESYRKIVDVRGMSLEEVKNIVSSNYWKLFG